MNGSVFTPVEPLLTSAIPTEEDGYTYLALGLLCTMYQLMLIPEHTLYRFVDGAFKPLSQIGYEAYTEVGNLRTETQTAIEQTNAAIALKADATTVSNLEQRVEWVAAGAEEAKSSGIYINPNNVAITTENFLLQLLDPANMKTCSWK